MSTPRDKLDSVTTPPLDDIDRRLIEALQHDGRATYADLAELVGLSPLPPGCVSSASWTPGSCRWWESPTRWRSATR